MPIRPLKDKEAGKLEILRLQFERADGINMQTDISSFDFGRNLGHFFSNIRKGVQKLKIDLSTLDRTGQASNDEIETRLSRAEAYARFLNMDAEKKYFEEKVRKGDEISDRFLRTDAAQSLKIIQYQLKKLENLAEFMDSSNLTQLEIFQTFLKNASEDRKAAITEWKDQKSQEDFNFNSNGYFSIQSDLVEVKARTKHRKKRKLDSSNGIRHEDINRAVKKAHLQSIRQDFLSLCTVSVMDDATLVSKFRGVKDMLEYKYQKEKHPSDKELTLSDIVNQTVSSIMRNYWAFGQIPKAVHEEMNELADSIKTRAAKLDL